MAIKFAEIGQRRGQVTVTISKRTKLMSFSSGFHAKYLRDRAPAYIREGYDDEVNKVVVEFCDADDDSGQLLKLSYTDTKKASAGGITPVLNNFGLELDDLVGTYRSDAIEVTTLEGTDREIFLFDVSKRKK